MSHGRKFQSAPPRGRRRDRLPHYSGLGLVSIRASAREATLDTVSGLPADVVSIRASAREATSARPRRLSGNRRFNPRLRAGGDDQSVVAGVTGKEFQSAPPRGRRLGQCIPFRLGEDVSIRASAREATGVTCASSRAEGKFQSAPPRGRRLLSSFSHHDPQEFQSAPPRGRRQEQINDAIDSDMFQSAPPRGRRP